MHLGHGFQVPRDHPVVAHLAVSPFLGERDVDRFLVDIHPHEHATFCHDLPPFERAIELHVRGLREDGIDFYATVEVAA
jgi:hypothetical protein